MKNDKEYLVHDDTDTSEVEFRKDCLNGKYTEEQLREWGFSEHSIDYYFNKKEKISI